MKTNPDIHIICGKCGCSTMFEFSLRREEKIIEVCIVCDNCCTVTGLDEIITDNTDYSKLNLTNPT